MDISFFLCGYLTVGPLLTKPKLMMSLEITLQGRSEFPIRLCTDSLQTSMYREDTAIQRQGMLIEHITED